MIVYRCVYFYLKHNSYLILGLIFGVLVSLNYFDEPSCEIEFATEAPRSEGTTDGYDPRFVENKDRAEAPKRGKAVQRPRYYSTELGIKEKLFVGVVTSERTIGRAIVVNKTLAHLVDKIKFFITASEVRTDLNLTNVVGFTDTRQILKPFHVLKYICDNYPDDYDYYFLVGDEAYVDGRRLGDLVSGISVSRDVHMGTPAEPDSPYCRLDAGILISGSVLAKIKQNLDWCVRNAYSKESHENVGRCIIHSANLKCSSELQDRHLKSFPLPANWNLETDLKDVVQNEEFNAAVSVFPVRDRADFYSLHLYFARLRLESIDKETEALSGPVSEDSADGNWPAGLRTDPTLPSPRPPDRFHQPRRTVINETHNLMPDDYGNLAEHTDVEKLDIDNAISAVVSKVENENPNLKYRSLANGYRYFNPALGMSYTFDMRFADAGDGQTVTKRMEAFKPLGKATILSVPYVTENTRIILILPVRQYEIGAAFDFLKHFETSFLERKDKFFVLTVLMYPAEAPSKGPEDAFGTLKQKALDLSEKYKADSLKVAWLSIRLPSLSNMMDDAGALNVATIDLALRKVPLDSLVLVGRPQMELKPDYLNRVRMNTIPGYQIFSAIGFQLYHPSLSAGVIPSKTSGRFASWDSSVLSFYSRDYVAIRKTIQDIYPIVRSDKDIEALLGKAGNLTSVYDMFVRHSSDLHVFRGVEPGLVFKYDETVFCPPGGLYRNSSLGDVEPEYVAGFGLTEKCLNNFSKTNFNAFTVGSRSQLASLIFK